VLLGLLVVAEIPWAKIGMAHRWLQRIAMLLLVLFGVGVVSLPFWFKPEMTGADQLTELHAAMRPHGRLVVYRWPRSQMLYEFGAPLPWARSIRDLYEKISRGEIRPGDYLLVDKKYYPGHTEDLPPNSVILIALPQYFELVAATKGYVLYRVRPEATTYSAPSTPEPPPVQWWEKFDTD
jgi:hypothetical protein